MNFNHLINGSIKELIFYFKNGELNKQWTLSSSKYLSKGANNLNNNSKN